MKIRLLGNQLFHVDVRMDERTDEWKDGQTDMRKLKVAFYNFVIASKSKQRKE